MLSHEDYHLEDNLQCTCFDLPSPQEQYFLSKNLLGELQEKIITTNSTHTSTEDALSRTSSKKSLKKHTKFPKQRVPTEQSSLSHRNITFPPFKQTQPHELKRFQRKGSLLLSHKTPLATNKVQNKEKIAEIPAYFKSSSPKIMLRHQTEMPKISFSFQFTKPREEPKHQQPTHQTINRKQTQKPRSHIKKKMSLNFVISDHHSPPTPERTHSETFENESQLQNQEEHNTSIFSTTSITNRHKHLKNKEDQQEQKFLINVHHCPPHHNQLKKHHIPNKQGITFPTSTHQEQKKQKQNDKKLKTKLTISKMSEVEQIKSFVDQNEIRESEEESVVLGRLQQLNSIEFPRNSFNIPQLDKQINDQDSLSSSIMNSRPITSHFDLTTI